MRYDDLEEKQFIKNACPHCDGTGAISTVNILWLVATRERAGVTQRAIAKKLGFSPAYLSDIEHGRRKCSQRILAVYETLRPAHD